MGEMPLTSLNPQPAAPFLQGAELHSAMSVPVPRWGDSRQYWGGRKTLVISPISTIHCKLLPMPSVCMTIF